MKKHALSCLVFALAWVWVGSTAQAAITLTLKTSASTVALGESLTLTATVSGTPNAVLTWSVDGVTNGNSTTGMLTGTGLTRTYTAPPVNVPNPNPVTFKILSAADNTTSQTATATVADTIVVTVNPSSTKVALGGTQVFTATISNTMNTALNWYVNGVLDGNATQGTLTGTGLTRTYTAPPVDVPSPNSAWIRVVSAADPAKYTTVKVTVTDSIAITLSPSSASVALGGTKLFTATISNTANTGLYWYVNGYHNGSSTQGKLSACTTTAPLTCTYTAPPVDVPSPNPAVIKVASVADLSKFETANATVTDTIGVTLSPASASVALNSTQLFTAAISNTPNTALNWYVNGVPNGNSTQGALTGTGLTRTYTAPPVDVPSPNPVVIEAASAADPSKSKTVLATVTDKIAVTLSPLSKSLALGSTQVFTATISNTTNPALNWYVNGVLNGNAMQGTLSGSGLTRTYAAPMVSAPSPNPVVIEVVSVADPTKFKTANVTVQVVLVGFSVSSMSFLNQAKDTTSAAQTVTASNLGNVNLTFSKVAIGGTDPGEFAVSADTCMGANVAPNHTCAVSVKFTPSLAGGSSASLDFSDNAPGSPQTVILEGNGPGPLTGVFTQRYDNARSGANTHEVYLTPSNVTVDRFGKLFSLSTDGDVYAQPLYMENVSIPSHGMHNVLFVATQNDSVYAFDADGQSTTPLWRVSFINPAAGVTTVPCQDVYGGSTASCDIAPVIGITSTPVIDPDDGVLYLTAKTKELQEATCTSNCGYNYVYRLHALDITTGAEKFRGPVMISASVPGTGYDNVGGTVTFAAKQQLQRPGLLLLNGTLYIGFGSQGDVDDYHGWLMAYNATTLKQMAVFNTTPNARRGAIWQGGGGISADTNVPPNLYIVTANGDFDANTGGVDYSDSTLRMQLVPLTSGQFQFQVLDYFTPADQAWMEGNDLDLGSSPALLLPDQPGPYPHLLATGGKDGRIWLLNRDNLGKYIRTPVADAGAVQVIPDGSDALFGGGDYWKGNLYVQETGDYLKQYVLKDGTAPNPPILSADEFPSYPYFVPSVSANGNSNGVLWIVHRQVTGEPCIPSSAILYAFDASDVGNELYNSCGPTNSQRDQAGGVVKFVVPTVANGKVYVGTRMEVDVYGLLP